MATAVHPPASHSAHHSYRHHTFSSSSTASSSTHSSTPRSTLHKQSSSYRTVSSAASAIAMASYSSQSSTGADGRPRSSHDGQSQHLHGKLHKRSISKETTVSVPTPTHEEFFPTDQTHHKKGIIKPLSLLKKVSSSGGSGKLDLGKSDGGAGGVYYTSSSPYIGGRASATDLTSFVPTHRQQHKRTTSNNSAGSHNSSPAYYPRRYAPTPTPSYPNSIGGDSESTGEDDDDYLETSGFGGRKRGVASTASAAAAAAAVAAVASGSSSTSASATPTQQPLRVVTSSTGLPLVLPPRIPVSESAPISPITPLNRSATVDSFDRKRNDSIDRKRKDSIDRKRKIVGGRNSSEDHMESMKQARAKFEEQERRKDEKEERRARKSISKEERRRSISKEESRRPSHDATTTTVTGSHAPRPRWFSARHSTPELGTTTEKTIGIPYGAGGRGIGQKSAATSLRNVPMRAGDEGGRRSRNEKRIAGSGAGPRGFKNQWQGFVMWVQIGFVRMGRKL